MPPERIQHGHSVCTQEAERECLSVNKKKVCPCVWVPVCGRVQERERREREREGESNLFPEANSTNVLKTNFRLAVNEA